MLGGLAAIGAPVLVLYMSLGVGIPAIETETRKTFGEGTVQLRGSLEVELNTEH